MKILSKVGDGLFGPSSPQTLKLGILALYFLQNHISLWVCINRYFSIQMLRLIKMFNCFRLISTHFITIQ
jgi:hypothetical protein